MPGSSARATYYLPEANLTFARCKAVCAGASACKGFSFQAAVPVPAGVVGCYTKVVAAFVPVSKRGDCPTPGGAGMTRCAPLPGEMGLGGYYGHYQGHWLSAMAFMFNNTGDAGVKRQAAQVVAAFAGAMEAWATKYGAVYGGYLFPYDPVVFAMLEGTARGEGVYTVPFYTTHKIMAGLLDQWTHAGNAQAFGMVKAMAAWTRFNVEAVLKRGGQELWQRVLCTEWGGMNEVLFNLYALTGDPAHLATARYFNHWAWTAPLAVGADDLDHQHANTHIPEVSATTARCTRHRCVPSSGHETPRFRILLHGACPRLFGTEQYIVLRQTDEHGAAVPRSSATPAGTS